MPKIRESYTIMTVTIDPKLKGWLQDREGSISAANEVCVKEAHKKWVEHQRDIKMGHRRLDEEAYEWNTEMRKKDGARRRAAELLHYLTHAEIKSDRMRMLRYEVRALIQEMRKNDE